MGILQTYGLMDYTTPNQYRKGCKYYSSMFSFALQVKLNLKVQMVHDIILVKTTNNTIWCNKLTYIFCMGKYHVVKEKEKKHFVVSSGPEISPTLTLKSNVTYYSKSKL